MSLRKSDRQGRASNIRGQHCYYHALYSRRPVHLAKLFLETDLVQPPKYTDRLMSCKMATEADRSRSKAQTCYLRMCQCFKSCIFSLASHTGPAIRKVRAVLAPGNRMNQGSETGEKRKREVGGILITDSNEWETWSPEMLLISHTGSLERTALNVKASRHF